MSMFPKIDHALPLSPPPRPCSTCLANARTRMLTHTRTHTRTHGHTHARTHAHLLYISCAYSSSPTALALGSLTKKVEALSTAQRARCKDCQEAHHGAGAQERGDDQGTVSPEEAVLRKGRLAGAKLAQVRRRALARVQGRRRSFH